MWWFITWFTLRLPSFWLRMHAESNSLRRRGGGIIARQLTGQEDFCRNIYILPSPLSAVVSFSRLAKNAQSTENSQAKPSQESAFCIP